MEKNISDNEFEDSSSAGWSSTIDWSKAQKSEPWPEPDASTGWSSTVDWSKAQKSEPWPEPNASTGWSSNIDWSKAQKSEPWPDVKEKSSQESFIDKDSSFVDNIIPSAKAEEEIQPFITSVPEEEIKPFIEPEEEIQPFITKEPEIEETEEVENNTASSIYNNMPSVYDKRIDPVVLDTPILENQTQEELKDIIDYNDRMLKNNEGVLSEEQVASLNTITANAQGILDTRDIEEATRIITNLKLVITESIQSNLNQAVLSFSNLYSKTQAKLSEKGITGDSLKTEFNGMVNDWLSQLDNILTIRLNASQEQTEETDESGSEPAAVPVFASNIVENNRRPSNNNSNHNSNIDDVEPDNSENNDLENNDDDNTENNNQPGTNETFIQEAVAGTLTFTNLIPLYENLGSSSTIQSSLTQSYDVTGIVVYGGKYYYRLYDHELNNFYYAEIDNSSVLKTDFEVLILNNQETMMLSSANIGEDVFVKMTDVNVVYFVVDTIEQDNITFAQVLDSSDGKKYYIPLGDAVQVTDLNSLINLNNNTSTDFSSSEAIYGEV